MIRPILFSGDMVRAILAGSKTQTRRPVKPQPPYHLDICRPSDNIRLHGCGRGRFHWTNGMQWEFWPGGLHGENNDMIPPYSYGDLLWVRETWRRFNVGVEWRANYESHEPRHGGIWHPSIHMPRWAFRLVLRVEDVRVQRVQEISEKEAQAEGSEAMHEDDLGQTWKTYRRGFQSLWDYIYAAKGLGWEANPWVWAVEFRVAAKTLNEAQAILGAA